MIGSLNSNFYFSFPNEGHEKTLSFYPGPFLSFCCKLVFGDEERGGGGWPCFTVEANHGADRRKQSWLEKEEGKVYKSIFCFRVGCSCLENPRDGRTWWAVAYGVAQSGTWLKRLSSSSISYPVLCVFYFLSKELSNISSKCYTVYVDYTSIKFCVCI